jgi:hypothetical protein
MVVRLSRYITPGNDGDVNKNIPANASARIAGKKHSSLPAVAQARAMSSGHTIRRGVE